MAPFIISFAVLCAFLSFGLKFRFTWTWYAGWVVLYLYAAYVGSFFVSALILSQTYQGIGFAALYLLGGFLFWIPFTIWWGKNRNLFGKQKTQSAE